MKLHITLPIKDHRHEFSRVLIPFIKWLQGHTCIPQVMKFRNYNFSLSKGDPIEKDSTINFSQVNSTTSSSFMQEINDE